MDRAQILAGIQRRRRFTPEQKLSLLQEAAQPGMTISYVARRHGIAASQLFSWRRRMSEGGTEAIRADDEVVAKSEVLALQKQIRELQRILGKKTVENEILREAVKIAHKKTDLAVTLVTGRGYAVKQVSDAREISRSNLTERLGGKCKPRSHYHKAQDSDLLEPLRCLVDARPTYGYRRITALLNRERQRQVVPRINHNALDTCDREVMA